MNAPTAAAPLRLAVVDDNALFRRTVARLLDRRAELTLVAEAKSGAELPAVLDSDAQVILLDIEIGAESGFDLLERCRHEAPTVSVILLTGHDPAGLEAAAVAGGALGCRSKNDLRELFDNLAAHGCSGIRPGG